MSTLKLNINWKLILAISILGLLHGVLSLFGIVRGWEQTIWIVFGLLSIISIVWKVKTNFFLHGLLMGLGITIFTGLPQSFFLDTYLNANPDIREQLDPTKNYSLFVLAFIPVFGSVYGLLIGIISLGIKRLTKNKREVNNDKSLL